MNSKKTVLIIDDIIQFTHLLHDMISTNDDFEVIGKCHDGIEGLDGIKTLEPDLVILDIIMPRLDGLGLLERLNELQQEGSLKKRPKILVLSAANQESIAKNALALGADYYMLKPFDFNSLMARIKQMAHADDLEDGSVAGAEYKIQTIMNTIGVPIHIKGYRYLLEAVMMISGNPELMNKMTLVVYPKIGEKFNTNGASVERAIRNAIELTLERGDHQEIKVMFGSLIHNKKGKVSNSEFISLLYTRLISS